MRSRPADTRALSQYLRVAHCYPQPQRGTIGWFDCCQGFERQSDVQSTHAATQLLLEVVGVASLHYRKKKKKIWMPLATYFVERKTVDIPVQKGTP